jgi:DNA repair exonuclease SbcCD nuclease subunit
MKKQPILVLADPHFHNYKNHSTTIGGKNSRLLHVAETVKAAIDIGGEKGCGAVAIAGDIFHVRGAVRPSVLMTVAECLEYAVSRDIEVVLIPGNHDMEYFRGGETAVDILSEMKKVHVLDGKAPWLIGGWDIVGIPYIHDVEEFKDAFGKLLALEKPDLVLMHQGVDDFKPSETTPETGIVASALENDGWVISGHYHTAKKVGRVLSPGAPLQHTFGDEGQERGCWVLTEGDAEFIPIDVAPKFYTVSTAKDLKKLKAPCFVRIKAKTERAAKSLREKALEAGAESVVVQLEKSFATAHEKTVKLSTPRQMIRDYLALKEEIPAEDGDRVLALFDEVCL